MNSTWECSENKKFNLTSWCRVRTVCKDANGTCCGCSMPDAEFVFVLVALLIPVAVRVATRARTLARCGVATSFIQDAPSLDSTLKTNGYRICRWYTNSCVKFSQSFDSHITIRQSDAMCLLYIIRAQPTSLPRRKTVLYRDRMSDRKPPHSSTQA